jgi:hypothetical protein
MSSAKLISQPSTDDGTFGELVTDSGLRLATGELPWKNNDHGKSCIPAGIYRCHWIRSPKHGWCYQIMDVPGRSMIEIHSANFMGDVDKGKVSQLLGCVALGLSVGELAPSPVQEAQMAVLHSKDAITAFDNDMNGADFMLKIERL